MSYQPESCGTCECCEAWRKRVEAEVEAHAETKRQLEEANSAIPMKLYVWTCEPSFVAVAHARSVEEARFRMIEEVGASGDGSCPERDKARRYIQENNPTIWYGVNAEFALTDSAELIELSAFLECEQRKLRDAEHRLSDATGQAVRLEALERIVTAAGNYILRLRQLVYSNVPGVRERAMEEINAFGSEYTLELSRLPNAAAFQPAASPKEKA